MTLRCYLLSLLQIRHPDCEHCNARETSGHEMRERLEELNLRTQRHSLKSADQEEPAELIYSDPVEIPVSPPLSLQKNIASKGASIAEQP